MRACTAFLTVDPLSRWYYWDKGLAAWVRRIIGSEKPDCIFVFSSVMAQYVLGASLPARFLVDFVMLIPRSGPSLPPREIFLSGRFIVGRRGGSCNLIGLLLRKPMLAYSSLEAEAELFRNRAPEVREKVTAISNGIDSIHFSPENAGRKPDITGQPLLVFTGQMDYWPNVDAVVWFGENVLPALQKKFPGTTLCIVGARPDRGGSCTAFASRYTHHGAVPDVRPYVGHADIVVAPLRIGRGIQNKVLEGMAMGRP